MKTDKINTFEITPPPARTFIYVFKLLVKNVCSKANKT